MGTVVYLRFIYGGQQLRRSEANNPLRHRCKVRAQTSNAFPSNWCKMQYATGLFARSVVFSSIGYGQSAHNHGVPRFSPGVNMTKVDPRLHYLPICTAPRPSVGLNIRPLAKSKIRTLGLARVALNKAKRISTCSLMPSPLGVKIGGAINRSPISWLLPTRSGRKTIFARRSAASTDCQSPGC